MNKRNLLLTLALPAMLCQTAQAKIKNPLAKYHPARAAAGRTTDAAASRLIGAADRTYNGTSFILSDSAALAYSGTRGGDLTHPLMFDNLREWAYTTDSTGSQTAYVMQTFDSVNNLTTAVTQVPDSATGVLVNQYKTLYFYTMASGTQPDNIIDQTWNGTNWVNYDKYTYSYSGSKVTFAQYMLWDSLSSTFKPNAEAIYNYDGSGNETSEIDESYNTSAAAFIYTYKTDYTYDSANRLLTASYSTFNGSSFAHTAMYTYSYDAAGDQLTSLYATYDSATHAWDNNMLATYSSFTGALMPQTEIDQTYDTSAGGSFRNTTMYTYTYNSYNQLTSYTSESYNPAGFWEYATGDDMSNFYYETYTTAVKNITAISGAANVYPVPAQNTLHIDLTWDAPQAFTITIMDMQGRTAGQWNMAAAAQYSGTIPVSNLSAGNYIIRITGAAQGQVVKQLVIAH